MESIVYIFWQGKVNGLERNIDVPTIINTNKIYRIYRNVIMNFLTKCSSQYPTQTLYHDISLNKENDTRITKLYNLPV